MSWFRENRFLGSLLVAFTMGLLASGWFLFSAYSSYSEACVRFAGNAAELKRLQNSMPFPSGENLRSMKAHTEDLSSAVAKLRDELKRRMLPQTPLAPNEFQAHLRQASGAVAEKARTAKVKIPAPFYLGFPEYTTSLPPADVAPALGQELSQIELLVGLLAEAHVDAITAFRRLPASRPTAGATPAKTAPTPGAEPGLLDRRVVEVSFVGQPAAARRALNQIAGVSQQFYIIRSLHVRNEKLIGPPREAAEKLAPAAPKISGGGALNFIVGNELIEVSAQIEIVNFTF
ncbi:MAG: Amuc_1100 family pilus-like protein [Verrucomicrobiota bacterium]|nr:Amuc_1100 family pilus-like protein [Verrucomicrobiota bacterium]